MNRRIFYITVVLMLMTRNIFSQDTVRVAGDVSPGEGNLNRTIKKVTDAGKLSTTVFKLELNGRYVLTDSILVPAGEYLRIEASEPGVTQVAAPPQILCAAGPTEFSPSPVKKMIKCYGKIILKNLWLYFGTIHGKQTGANIEIANSNEVTGLQTGVFENIIFDYLGVSIDGSGTIGVLSKQFNGSFKNCYWKNCIDPHFRYYGRAISFPYSSPSWHINKITFENCTFANIGYVYQQENGNYADEIKFNHCTFLNVMMYSLESGWWKEMSVTNSIFVNSYMFGDIPAVTGKNDQNGGTIRIDSIKNFGFAVPYKEPERKILFSNNSYYIENWLKNWMSNSPYAVILNKNKHYDQIPQPQPMLSKGTLKFFESMDVNGKKEFPLMNKANLYDGVNPYLVFPPSDTALIKSFLYRKWGNSTDEYWAYKPELSLQRVWPMEEDIAYTNDTLLKAGMGSFPLGDLYRWFPDKYKLWKGQEDIENDRISTWLETGKDKSVSVRDDKNEIPTGFYLSQNYPNPFNPTTVISYQLPAFSYVTLKVYDILGREVATLVNEFKSPGNYNSQFPSSRAGSTLDSQLPSGVYLYKMSAGDFISIKKMLLIK